MIYTTTKFRRLIHTSLWLHRKGHSSSHFFLVNYFCFHIIYFICNPYLEFNVFTSTSGVFSSHNLSFYHISPLLILLANFILYFNNSFIFKSFVVYNVQIIQYYINCYNEGFSLKIIQIATLLTFNNPSKFKIFFYTHITIENNKLPICPPRGQYNISILE